MLKYSIKKMTFKQGRLVLYMKLSEKTIFTFESVLSVAYMLLLVRDISL